MKEFFVSYCLFTYNQEKFVRDAVMSAFDQTYDNMEIIISDDCSNDHTVEIIKDIIANYKGNKSVHLNVNKSNLGIRENVNKVIYELAKGDIILFAAGDDVSLPMRTEIYVRYFQRFPELMSISCMSEEVDQNLRPIDSLNSFFTNNFTIYNLDDYLEHKDFLIYSGDSRAIKRTVIDSFPKLKYPRAEDLFIFFRSLLLGANCYIRTPLVKRRHHDNNVSSSFATTAIIKKTNMQLHEDLTYALKNNYISENMEKKAREKIEHIKECDILYNTKPTYSFKTFVFRCLRKILKLTK